MTFGRTVTFPLMQSVVQCDKQILRVLYKGLCGVKYLVPARGRREPAGSGGLRRSLPAVRPRPAVHSENPRNVGSFDKTPKNVGPGLVGASACRDIMKLQIQGYEKGKIVDAGFKTLGCGSAIASSSFPTGRKNGCKEALALKSTDIAEDPGFPPVKLRCSRPAEDAIKAAPADHKLKQEPKAGEAEEQ
ncbi:iron-sulfur cluster assembly scaffold protein IscU-like [Dasypus novemcinctus]|uniref:iron-sulfur cluster assembly scaffold protein IscU-like n=1 Tax=Dasypus novemcinctus TaxID=9361 RepID=UPI000328BDD8|nr:iron-sulfur cluster assembly enzyme ISCU-like [Dasypus novemcinctus]